MPEILELPELAKDQGVTQMQIGTGGIDAQFHAQRSAERELLPQLRLADDLGRALLEKGKSFVRLHGPRVQEPGLLALVQQFSHLLNRERRVVGRQCFLAFAAIEKRPVARKLTHRGAR